MEYDTAPKVSYRLHFKSGSNLALTRSISAVFANELTVKFSTVVECNTSENLR